MNRILFSYSTTGDSDNKSKNKSKWKFIMYDNGQCMYIRYTPGKKEKYRRYIIISDKAFKQISRIIQKYGVVIDYMKEMNLKRYFQEDAKFYNFIFYDTELKCQFDVDKNIFRDNRDIIDYERSVMQIFNEICNELRYDGIEMNLKSFRRKVLFSYSCLSSIEGIEGVNFGEWSFRIYEDGKCAHIRYLTGGVEECRRNIFVSRESILNIKKIIEKYKVQLEFLDKVELNNGSQSGEVNIFEFENARIEGLNIQHLDMKKVKRDNEEYFLKYKDNIIYENTIMQIFKEICWELENDNIEMNIHKFRRKPGLIIR